MTQDLIVYLIVLAAVVYLARTWTATGKGSKGCGCASGGGCSKIKKTTPQVPATTALIQINLNGLSDNREANQLIPPRRKPQ